MKTDVSRPDPIFSLRAEQVVQVLTRLCRERGAPLRVFCDNGSEFSGRSFDLWAYHHHVQIDFNRPGKPTDNAYIESFNKSFRVECLNAHWFESMSDAKFTIEAWRQEYNVTRPHRVLNNQTPHEFAAQQ